MVKYSLRVGPDSSHLVPVSSHISNHDKGWGDGLGVYHLLHDVVACKIYARRG